VIRPRNEHSLTTACEVSGRGYWSGIEVSVRFLPAPAGAGIRFVRSDLPGRPGCDAVCGSASEASFRTNLVNGTVRFEMVEHVMAALYALEIDNCIVEVSGEELPGMDGSSIAYVEALQAVGLIVQASARKRYIVDRVFRVGDETHWIEASPVTDGHPVFEYHLDYGDDSAIVAQSYRGCLDAYTFCRELASARTFVTADQVEMLQAKGVGRHVGPGDLLVFGRDGLVSNSLRFSNECARHKALDLVGDLALAGVDLVGRFVSHRGGHRLNAELANLLARFAKTSYMSIGTGSQFAPPIYPRTIHYSQSDTTGPSVVGKAAAKTVDIGDPSRKKVA
jgi:UDP-3-O-[3-hydroxymyristoyl] N-acetylglucosamine deacetylase